MLLLIGKSLTIHQDINIFLAFGVGFLSFFSPCVFPLIPMYMGYLAGKGIEQEDGSIIYSKKTTLINTIFFVLGISSVFFILGMGFTGIGAFFSNLTQNSLFIRIISIIIILFGLQQLGLFRIGLLNKTKKINLNLGKNIGIGKAFILGLLFSFGWTPCIGPGLASILSIAATSETILYGNILIIIYTLGFIIPFLLLGIFATYLLNLLKKHRDIVTWTSKVGAILLIAIGISMFIKTI